MNWRKYFDQVYVVHCADYSDRLGPLKAELGRVGILDSGILSWKIVSPCFSDSLKSRFDMTEGAKSLARSWLDICAECMAMGYGRVLILEDDVRFLRDLDRVRDFMDMLPGTSIVSLDWLHNCSRLDSARRERLAETMESNSENRLFFRPDTKFHGEMWSTTAVAVTRDGARMIRDVLSGGLVTTDWFQNNAGEVPGLTVSFPKSPVAKQANFKGAQADYDKWTVMQGFDPADYAIGPVDAASEAIRWEDYFDAIYLLHCREDRERLPNIRRELCRVGIWDSRVFKVRNSFRGRWAEVLTRATTHSYVRPLFADAVGYTDCAYNTLAIMNEVQEAGCRRVLILEDDVVFLRDLSKLKGVLDSIPANADLMQFESMERPETALQAMGCGAPFRWIPGGMNTGAACYALSDRGVKAMLDFLNVHLYPVDQVFKFLGVRWFQTAAPCAVQLVYDPKSPGGSRYTFDYGGKVGELYCVPDGYMPRSGMHGVGGGVCDAGSPEPSLIPLGGDPPPGLHVCYDLSVPFKKRTMDVFMISLDSLRRSSRNPDEVFVHVYTDGGMSVFDGIYGEAMSAFASSGGFGGFEVVDLGPRAREVAGIGPGGKLPPGSFRFLIPGSLPECVERAIVLSPYTVCVRDLWQLYMEDLGGRPAGSPPKFDRYMHDPKAALHTAVPDNLDEGVVLLECGAFRSKEFADSLGGMFSDGKAPGMDCVPGGVETLSPMYSHPLLYHAIFKAVKESDKYVLDAESRFSALFAGTRYTRLAVAAVIFRLDSGGENEHFSLTCSRDFMWDRLEGVEAFIGRKALPDELR